MICAMLFLTWHRICHVWLLMPYVHSHHHTCYLILLAVWKVASLPFNKGHIRQGSVPYEDGSTVGSAKACP